MRQVRRTGQFKRDVKRMEKRGKDFSALREVIQRLATGESLEPRHRDHPLLGGYAGSRECHVQADWLLIYERTEDELVLVRTGTHSDLFGEYRYRGRCGRIFSCCLDEARIEVRANGPATRRGG
jgi:mRNA interferase YafQ